MQLQPKIAYMLNQLTLNKMVDIFSLSISSDPRPSTTITCKSGEDSFECFINPLQLLSTEDASRSQRLCVGTAGSYFRRKELPVE